MCGRFTLHTPLGILLSRFSLPGLDFNYAPSYNIAPTQGVFTVVSNKERRTASLMRWGLTPSWLKDGKSGRPLINARLETLAETRTFGKLVNSSRCLVIADGFYEWKTEDSAKHPMYITLDEGRPFAFAALWEHGPNPSCTIVTQEASPFLKPVHHRMPVILNKEAEELWLGPAPFEEVQELLPNQAERTFAYHRVSTLVNAPRNNEATCILPVD